MDFSEASQTFLAVALQLSVHKRATVSIKANTCFHTRVDPDHVSGWLNDRTLLQLFARPFLEIAVIVRFPQIEHADFDTIVVLEPPDWVLCSGFLGKRQSQWVVNDGPLIRSVFQYETACSALDKHPLQRIQCQSIIRGAASNVSVRTDKPSLYQRPSTRNGC